MAAAKDTPEAGARSPLGMNIAGYFDSTLGVGEAARQTRGALEAAGLAVASFTLPERRSNGPQPSPPPSRPPFSTTLVCANADAMDGARDWLGPGFFAGRTIAIWWWEVDKVPEHWQRSVESLDEIWVGSRFVADAIAPAVAVPVVRMPLPVAPALPPSSSSLDLPEGFFFLFVFDFASGFERKNPLGAIEAFAQAFPEGSGPSLVVKHVGAEGHEEQLAQLEAAAARRSDVHLIGGRLAPQDRAALTAACGCYLSLHRSEGFGLTLAEAVLAGKPVVATGYSGPLDFLGPATAFLVDHDLRAVGPGNAPYPPDAVWAEPDLGHAARLMQEVHSDPEAARARGEGAREGFVRTHSPEAAGRAMAGRLARLAHLPAQAASPAGSLDLSELERRLSVRPSEASASSVRRRIGRIVERVTRPQSVRQQRVDEEMVRTLRALDRRLEGLADAQRDLAARIDRERAGAGDPPA